MIEPDPKPITVGELIEFLKQFPKDLKVVETRYSDFRFMRLKDWEIVRAFDTTNRRGYLMLYHENDWKLNNPDYKSDNLGPIKHYLCFQGN